LLLLQSVPSGVSEMETANWDAAIQSFGHMLTGLQREEPGLLHTPQTPPSFAAAAAAAVLTALQACFRRHTLKVT
jgi:hypothetical protein